MNGAACEYAFRKGASTGLVQPQLAIQSCKSAICLFWTGEIKAMPWEKMLREVEERC